MPTPTGMATSPIATPMRMRDAEPALARKAIYVAVTARSTLLACQSGVPSWPTMKTVPAPATTMETRSSHWTAT